MGAGPWANYQHAASQSGPWQNYSSTQDQQTAPPDTRNAVQKEFDKLVTVTPEQEQGHSWLTNEAQKFGAGVIQGLGAPIVHPLNTLSGVANVLAHPIDTAEAMAKSAYHNPAQTAGNLAGGALLGNVVGEGANAAVGTVGRVAERAGVPARLYESALKPSTTIGQAERGGLVRTGLDNEIPVSKSGLKDIGTALDNLNQAVKDTINADPTRPISPIPALRNLQSIRARFATQVNPSADVQAVDSAGQEFADQLSNGQPGPNPQRNLTAAEAQAMKQGTYRALGNKAYGELKGASIEAQKALARGLKEEIANQFPELKNLNAQESKLFDLQPSLERAINRGANHQLIGIGTPVAASAGEMLTGSATAGGVVGALKFVLDNPMVKSRLAIALSKAAKIPIGQASARVQAYSATLGAYAGAMPQTSGDQTIPR